MSFVVKSGSKQYIVNSGSTLVVDRIKKEVGESVELDLVYAYGADSGAKKVTAKVVAHQKGKKIRVVKYRSKSNYHRQYGYRHYETVLEIEGEKKAPKAKTPAAKKTATKVEAKDASKPKAVKKASTKKTTSKETKKSDK